MLIPAYILLVLFGNNLHCLVFFMLSTQTNVNQKLGRNDPCPCGSGKKYKVCCAQRAASAAMQMNFEQVMQQAWQAVGQRNVAAVMHWFEKALSMRPGDPHALAGLGQALCWQERRREGLQYLQRAARELEAEAQHHGNPGFILELAEQLHFWGDLDTSLRLAKLAVEVAPTHLPALNNLALYFMRVNQPEAAEPYARMANMLNPDSPAVNNLLAILETRLGQLPEARQRFEQVIAADKDVKQTQRAWQELATVLDKLGEYDAAFEACERAKALFRDLPEVRRVDSNAIFRAIARNKAGFDQALLRRWQVSDFADNLPVPVFLIGFLRSGTTLTEQVLAAHPGVFNSDENNLIHGLVQALGRLSGCGEDVPAGLRRIGLTGARDLRALYWKRVRQEYGPEALQKVFVDKVALNSIDVGLISTLFPEAKIVFALRDPRDVCLSCYQQAFQPANVTVNLSSWQGVAKQYAAVMDYWLYVRDLIAPEYLQIRYEDTVGDFENTMRRVFALIGLEWVPEVAAFHENAKGRYIATPSFADVSQPIYNRSVDRWRRYENHFEPILPILQSYIHAFGYQS